MRKRPKMGFGVAFGFPRPPTKTSYSQKRDAPGVGASSFFCNTKNGIWVSSNKVPTQEKTRPGAAILRGHPLRGEAPLRKMHLYMAGLRDRGYVSKSGYPQNDDPKTLANFGKTGHPCVAFGVSFGVRARLRALRPRGGRVENALPVGAADALRNPRSRRPEARATGSFRLRCLRFHLGPAIKTHWMGIAAWPPFLKGAVWANGRGLKAGRSGPEREALERGARVAALVCIVILGRQPCPQHRTLGTTAKLVASAPKPDTHIYKHLLKTNDTCLTENWLLEEPPFLHENLNGS